MVTTENREIPSDKNRRVTDTPPGTYVALTVEDNGTGMDADTQAHLFEPFFTTKPEGKGTGLGLALVYGVVQQSGGFIKVKSVLLVGSTFEVLLPATSAPVEKTPTPVAPLPSVRGSESILLVEEDEVVRKMVAGILTADGYRVTAAKTFAALARDDAPASRPVQLLITNLVGEGEKFAKRLHTVQPGLRVLCTGNYDFKMPVDWLPGDRQVCLNKPYALSEPLRTVRKLLDA